MRALVSKYWWVFLLQGLLAIVFGILAWTWPALTLASLVLLFGAWAIVSGVVAIVTAFSGRSTHEDWWVLLLQGLAGVGVGLITYLAPGLTALTLVLYIAVWALLTGFLQIVTAIRMRKEIHGEGWMILGGILSVVFGGLLLAAPGEGALALTWLIACYAVALGVMLVLLAFRLRTLTAPRLAHQT